MSFHLGTLHTDGDFAPTTHEDILRSLEAVDENEIPDATSFLHRCLTLDPKCGRVIEKQLVIVIFEPVL